MTRIDQASIPPLPSVTMQVMRFDPQAEAADSHSLANLIAPDKGICVDLLRIANSAYYGRSGQIRTVRDALTLLGLKPAKNFILLLITRNMAENLKGPLFKKYLMEYPVIAALAAEELVRLLKLNLEVGDAFVTALLHNIGMTVLALNKKDHYELLMEHSERTGDSLIGLEKDAYGTRHDDVSRMAFAQWKLPESMQTVANQLNFSLDQTESVSDLSRVTTLAAIIAGKFTYSDLVEGPLEKEARIFAHYQAGKDVQSHFGPAFYDQVQQHPFYQFTMQSN